LFLDDLHDALPCFVGFGFREHATNTKAGYLVYIALQVVALEWLHVEPQSLLL
jgi:hypothetical protein